MKVEGLFLEFTSKQVIVGAGPLGLGLSQILAKDGFESVLVGRSDKIPVNAQFFWMTTKAYDVEGALQRIFREAPHASCVTVLSNGNHLALLKKFQLEFPRIRFCAGVATFGSRFVSEETRHEISLTGAVPGCIQVGWPAEFLLSSKYISIQPDIETIVNEKWFLNTVVNSLCGAYRLPRNGLLKQFPRETELLSEEVYALGQELFGNWKKSLAELRTVLESVVEQTFENENSMARDCRLFRTTETEFFAGLAVGRYRYPFLKLLHGVLVR